MTDTPSSSVQTSRKLFKLCFYCVLLLYAATVLTIWSVFRNPEWHAALVHFLRRVWAEFVSYRVGSTSPGFFSSLLCSILGIIAFAFCIRYLQGWTAMRKHLAETAAMALASLLTVAFLVYGTQFAWQVAATGYNEHVALKNQDVALKDKLAHAKDGMVDPRQLVEENTALKNELEMYKKQESPEVRVYPLAPGTRDPRIPRMEYILASGRIRTPVEIELGCDFPISKVDLTVLTTTGGSVMETNNRRISPTRYVLSLISPAWAPQDPLYITVFLAPPVDRMPTCSFESH